MQTPTTKIKSWLLRDSDPAALAFHQWIASEKVECQVEIADFELTGRGLAAANDIGRNDVVLRLPWKMILSVHKAQESPALAHIFKVLELDEDSMLMVFTLYERFVNPSSYWKPYWDSLPATVDSGLYFTASELSTFLDSNPLQMEILSMREHLMETYEQMIPKLVQAYPDLFPASLMTWENFVWVRSMFDSRGFHLDIQGKTYNCLLPLVDFLNNHNITLLEGSGVLQEPDRDYVIRTLVPLKPGQQVFMNYGSFSHRELLLFYGYESSGGDCNSYDVYPLDLEVPDDDGYAPLRSALLQKIGLSVEHYLKKDKPIPLRLLATMRVFLLPSSKVAQFLGSADADAVRAAIFDDIEKDVEAISLVQTLVLALRDSIEALSPWAAKTADLPEEFEGNERVRLAINFSAIQLLILREAEQKCAALLAA